MFVTKPLDATAETELIRRIRQGEKDLFEVLIRRSNPHLYKVGRAYGYNHQDVEDLMQETFIAAYLNIEKFKQRSSFKTWVIKIMMHQCYHKAHRLNHKYEKTINVYNESVVPMFEDLQSTDGYQKIADREFNQIMEQAITVIPLDYRIVFALRELNGMNTAETAEALNISETNAKVRLSRAKLLLRRWIDKVYRAENIFEFNLTYCDRVVNKVMGAIN